HGVMNTDNMTISGETIDYGPCAFMDSFDPATVFSSIDHGGRYAYGNQPRIAQWNLARLGETLLPLIDGNTDAAIEAATDALTSFVERYDGYWTSGMAAKLGLDAPDRPLIQDLLALLHAQRVDFTQFFRALSSHLWGRPARSLFTEPEAFDAWAARWQALLPRDRNAVTAAMDRVNPIYIPRNHRVEEALTAATDGDMAPFRRLVEIVASPFIQRPGLERYAEPAPLSCGPHVTYCGT
ncbi:MAG: protein adenylyltransferase SelO family protein, partial [Actinomycetota bacterium]|nr:protein adenylyltransferase SelO family protein [Actinomycetota bacterium]